jgi:hypothetical protein
LNPDLGNSITVIEVVLCTCVTSSVFFICTLNIEAIVIVLELFFNLFLASELVVEGVLYRGFLPVRHAIVRHVVYLSYNVKGETGSKNYLFCRDQRISKLAK